MRIILLVTNTYPESNWIDYVLALLSGDPYQLMPKRIRAEELRVVRGKPVFRSTIRPRSCEVDRWKEETLIWYGWCAVSQPLNISECPLYTESGRSVKPFKQSVSDPYRTINCPDSDPLRKLLLFWFEKGGPSIFLGFFCRTFFFKRHGRFFLGFSVTVLPFRHGYFPDKGWVVFMSTYQFNTLFQVNVMCIHFYVFDCPLLALSTSSMNMAEGPLSLESRRSEYSTRLPYWNSGLGKSWGDGQLPNKRQGG